MITQRNAREKTMPRRKDNNMNVRKMTAIGLLTAAYCVLSALMKIPFIGNISLDLGYIALTLACSLFGPWGAFVGAVGCGLESILFTAYGFSISWFTANLIIGLGCGLVFRKTEKVLIRIASIIVFVCIGMIGAKTIIECLLYGIPLAVKIPKNLVAFGIDSAVMIVALGIIKPIERLYHAKTKEE